MTDSKPLPDHQTIEDAFAPAKDVLKRLPETTESKRAADHLKMAQDYAHETRDRTKTNRVTDPEIDASVEMRGPAMLGWPFNSRTSIWCWTDGSAP